MAKEKHVTRFGVLAVPHKGKYYLDVFYNHKWKSFFGVHATNKSRNNSEYLVTIHADSVEVLSKRYEAVKKFWTSVFE